MKVLVAEDDTISRTILKRAVEEFGHECLTAEDGRAAWELFCAETDVDVIVSDWMMPRMDGLELCEKVRSEESENPERSYTYFMFLTALGSREYMLRGLEAGADDYLSKPLDRAELGMRLISASRVTELHRRLAYQNGELEELNRMLFEQSRQDPLTGLGNRLRLREDLEVLQARAKRYGHGYAIALCDVDHFKAYNDRHGHLAGDDVLRKVAHVIADHARSGDTAYRYGGEEFLIVLPEQTIEAAAITADRLRRSVEELSVAHEANPPSGLLTVSAGVAAASGTDTPDDILKRADAALYAAKEAGRNRVSPTGT